MDSEHRPPALTAPHPTSTTLPLQHQLTCQSSKPKPARSSASTSGPPSFLPPLKPAPFGPPAPPAQPANPPRAESLRPNRPNRSVPARRSKSQPAVLVLGHRVGSPMDGVKGWLLARGAWRGRSTGDRLRGVRRCEAGRAANKLPSGVPGVRRGAGGSVASGAQASGGRGGRRGRARGLVPKKWVGRAACWHRKRRGVRSRVNSGSKRQVGEETGDDSWNSCLGCARGRR